MGFLLCGSVLSFSAVGLLTSVADYQRLNEFFKKVKLLNAPDITSSLEGYDLYGSLGPSLVPSVFRRPVISGHLLSCNRFLRAECILYQSLFRKILNLILKQ